MFEFLEKENPDFICFQETKAQPEQIEKFFSAENKLFDESEIKKFSEYQYHFLNSAEKKGYSGTAVFAKQKTLSYKTGLPTLKECLNEGRVQTLEFENFFLINVYTPNSKSELERLDFRYNE